jgi:palmitoyltransferase ZDHHC13/17
VSTSFTPSILLPNLIYNDQVVTRVLLNKSTYTDSVNQSPYFAGIIFGSMVWVIFCWATRLVHRTSPLSSSPSLPPSTHFPKSPFNFTSISFIKLIISISETQSHAFTHLTFALLVGLCVYNFFRAITLDPGTCPKPTSDGELKSIIEDLASEGRLNGQTFCITCMVRFCLFFGLGGEGGLFMIFVGVGVVVG